MEASGSTLSGFEERVSELPEEQQAFATKLIEKFAQMKEIAAEEEGWKEGKKKDGFFIHTKKTDTGLNCIRGQGAMDFSADKVFEFIDTDGNITKYDSSYKEGRTIETPDLGVGLCFSYSRYKGGTMISDRDFCFIGASVKEEDGTYITWYTSAEHADCPAVKKCVRGELYIGGWIITPDKDDPENKCYAHYITQTNPKGSVPKYFVNKFSEGQGLLPYQINEILKKESA
eukprot:CAMPEP_0197001714 /NCGR_PEP_ID=MMETSP1380-20130617/6346_1 /TAXON_ID=5936 /ORGANISM="Euplotes crassus, Strain CT5" /LENGTH=229 /DNA_ID=CAMNT_0042419489 /DNA_START=59 /DNA_END=748 /DNA_ORIENTATION=+